MMLHPKSNMSIVEIIHWHSFEIEPVFLYELGSNQSLKLPGIVCQKVACMHFPELFLLWPVFPCWVLGSYHCAKKHHCILWINILHLFKLPLNFVISLAPNSSAKIKMICGRLSISVPTKMINTITDNTIVAVSPSTNKRETAKIPLFFIVFDSSGWESGSQCALLKQWP